MTREVDREQGARVAAAFTRDPTAAWTRLLTLLLIAFVLGWVMGALIGALFALAMS